MVQPDIRKLWSGGWWMTAQRRWAGDGASGAFCLGGKALPYLSTEDLPENRGNQRESSDEQAKTGERAC